MLAQLRKRPMQELARRRFLAGQLLADLRVREADDARERDDLAVLGGEAREGGLDATLLLVQDRLLARRAERRVLVEEVVDAALVLARRRVERDLLRERA